VSMSGTPGSSPARSRHAFSVLRQPTNAEKAKAWEVAAGYLDFSTEWEPDDGTSEESCEIIKAHIRRVVQPFLYRQAARVRSRAKSARS